MNQDEHNKLEDESEDARRFQASIDDHHDEIVEVVARPNRLTEVLKSIAVLSGVKTPLPDMRERNLQIEINRQNQEYRNRQEEK